jgi:hypothetical protein
MTPDTYAKINLIIAGLGLLIAVASCGSSRESSVGVQKTVSEAGCRQAEAYHEGAGIYGWDVQEILCGRYSDSLAVNAHVRSESCLVAAENIMKTNGKAGRDSIEKACWPDRYASIASESPECKKLRSEYERAHDEASLASSMMKYADAGVARGKGARIASLMQDSKCPHSPIK